MAYSQKKWGIMKDFYKYNYEKAQCDYIIRIKDLLVEHGIDFTESYSISYFSYCKISNFNRVDLKISNRNETNNSISINVALYETDKPFSLDLWFYNKGEHIFDKYCFADFDKKIIWNKIAKFYGFLEDTQLSIFDFLG